MREPKREQAIAKHLLRTLQWFVAIKHHCYLNYWDCVGIHKIKKGNDVILSVRERGDILLKVLAILPSSVILEIAVGNSKTEIPLALDGFILGLRAINGEAFKSTNISLPSKPEKCSPELLSQVQVNWLMTILGSVFSAIAQREKSKQEAISAANRHSEEQEHERYSNQMKDYEEQIRDYEMLQSRAKMFDSVKKRLSDVWTLQELRNAINNFYEILGVESCCHHILKTENFSEDSTWKLLVDEIVGTDVIISLYQRISQASSASESEDSIGQFFAYAELHNRTQPLEWDECYLLQLTDYFISKGYGDMRFDEDEHLRGFNSELAEIVNIKLKEIQSRWELMKQTRLLQKIADISLKQCQEQTQLLQEIADGQSDLSNQLEVVKDASQTAAVASSISAAKNIYDLLKGR